MALKIPHIIICTSLVAHAQPQSRDIDEFRRISNHEQLAQYIHKRLATKQSLKELINDLNSSEKINLPGDGEISCANVAATIITRKRPGLLEKNKKYQISCICSFVDTKNDINRFHVLKLTPQELEKLKKDITTPLAVP